MSRKTNTVPYTNDRREGRTQPDLIEIIKDIDPRSKNYRPEMLTPPNRAQRRVMAKRDKKGGTF